MSGGHSRTSSGLFLEMFTNRTGDARAIEPAVGEQLLRFTVLHEAIGESQHQQRNRDAVGGQELGHRGARPTRSNAFLDRYDDIVARREPEGELAVDRFHEAHALRDVAFSASRLPAPGRASSRRQDRDASPSRRISPRPIGSAFIAFAISAPGPVLT